MRRIGLITSALAASIAVAVSLSNGPSQPSNAAAKQVIGPAPPSQSSRSDPIDRVPIHRITIRAEKAFGHRYAGQWINRDVKPPVLKIAVVDATHADRMTLARISHHSRQVALASVRFTFRRIQAAAGIVEKVFERRHVRFITVEPSLIEQRVIVEVPRGVKRSIRQTIARGAEPVPVRYRIKPLRTVPASTRRHRWKVPKYVFRHGYEHRVTLGPSSRAIPISMESGYCVGDPKPTISRADATETSDSVTITAYLHKPKVKKGYSCDGALLELARTVHLAAPLRDRGLFDGSTSPPRPVPHGG
jgi:hypothetical protein